MSDIRKIIYQGAGSVSFFPNPTSDNLNVKLELGDRSYIEVKVLTMQGRVVYRNGQIEE